VQVLYLTAAGGLHSMEEPRLDDTTERHKIALRVDGPEHGRMPVDALEGNPALGGIVLEMSQGWIGRDRLLIARAALRLGQRAWAYWPTEEAVECLDRERIASAWRHWIVITAGWRLMRARRLAARIKGALRYYVRAFRDVRSRVPLWSMPGWVLRRLLRGPLLPPASTDGVTPIPHAVRAARLERLDAAKAAASPVPFPADALMSFASAMIPGCGVYLRTDYWTKIDSGGSYGHTCYVAKELARSTEQFVCFMAQRFTLLDDFGVRQVIIEPSSASASENDIVSATDHYVRILKPALEALRPAYIYERLVLGNYAGALLSRQLGVPYIVEYNGSEISMRRSFDGAGYLYEEEYLKAEELAFRQATAISVVSAEVRASLIARGVDPAKVLVNPNGADPDAYAPANPQERAAIRGEVGLPADACVVCFTGTFGGWHGVDVLAAAIPRVCAARRNVAFLLIGDGALKRLVDDEVARHHLADRVISSGRVAQAQGARLLKAADVFVSPHNSHMVDSRFFGSPTKVFEYMATGGAVVASDLEQIGEILSPALRIGHLADTDAIGAARSILCTPGSVDELVEAIGYLAEQPEVRARLGVNARRAVIEEYSWRQHVRKLWRFVAQAQFPPEPVAVGASIAVDRIETGDAYKDQVQHQWNNNPVGSQHAGDAPKHTLQWFLNVEAHRYGDYGPWMPEVMEFSGHSGEEVLEVGGGMGTDLAQFARHGAKVTDVDLSGGHLALARENFALRGLDGRFVHHDAETLPFPDNSFDVVYSNGVIHHTPNTTTAVREIHRVLRPGGRAIVMVYAENSWHYWRQLVWFLGLQQGQLATWSIGEIMSRSVERTANDAKPLVKVYTKERLRSLFAAFSDITIVQRQLTAPELPPRLRPHLTAIERRLGWNLIIKAHKAR
jgi:glycosyltransferase involved in cell wall biosynthesis/ubiquinone/menaquinone biosynthesis C-methylase UbiE